jgi:hypothetical protein
LVPVKAAVNAGPQKLVLEATLSTEMLSRFIISWSVVGLTRRSSAACFWTPADLAAARGR